ncbi:MAG TPA: type II toxin-antitoxin system PemK/MazF family toxin [Pirellulales bacterium]|jgi:mRNA interferase MazF|nr:type II toxin-antitoxin system PemK/MazF family toxin [Pirellulales bacterium]
MKVKRGDVVLLSMPFAQGGGSKIRPAVVVQNDRNNARLGNTIVAAITRNVSRASLPTQLLIDPATPAGQKSGLVAVSAVTCENLFTVGQNLIHRTIGSLSVDAMRQVSDCLRAALEID